jgi:DNA-binding CsgD family transcriptional regulator
MILTITQAAATIPRLAAERLTKRPKPMSRTSKPSENRRLAGIRQLCCLGLPGEIVVPKFLAALHGWLPTDTNHFFWPNEAGDPCNYYGETPGMENYPQLFMREFAVNPQHAAVPSFKQLVLSGASEPLYLGGEHSPEYRRSAYYNELMRHVGGRYIAAGVIRDRHRDFGVLSVLRGEDAPGYARSDLARFAEASRHLAFALAAEGSGGHANSPQHLDAQGMAILDGAGRIRHMDAEARRLLFLASHPSANAQTLRYVQAIRLPERLAALGGKLAAIFAGYPAGPPEFEHATPWGLFTFRGSWLEGEEGRRIACVVSHYLPKRLKFWRALADLGLPPRQAQAALHFAEGQSLSEIAGAMGVSRHTVIYHIDALYKKLNIEASRTALVERLLDGAPAMRRISLE